MWIRASTHQALTQIVMITGIKVDHIPDKGEAATPWQCVPASRVAA